MKNPSVYDYNMENQQIPRTGSRDYTDITIDSYSGGRTSTNSQSKPKGHFA